MRTFQVRREIEALYTDVCRVFEASAYLRADGSTGFVEQCVLEDEPCRLSFDNSRRAYQTDTVSHTMQTVRLFLPPERVVRAGSRIEVRRGGRTLVYKNSGLPAVYATHQEILLEPMHVEA